MSREMSFDQILARRDQLLEIRRSQGWTREQRAEWENLDKRWEMRLRRLPGQIAATRAKLARLEAMAS